ncbi:hypothetical protein [Pseudomonas laurylsulfatiphila]
MVKPTPNPPESEADTTQRASGLHLKPAILKNDAPHNPSTMFTIVPNIDTESLLAHACDPKEAFKAWQWIIEDNKEFQEDGDVPCAPLIEFHYGESNLSDLD